MAYNKERQELPMYEYNLSGDKFLEMSLTDKEVPVWFDYELSKLVGDGEFIAEGKLWIRIKRD